MVAESRKEYGLYRRDWDVIELAYSRSLYPQEKISSLESTGDQYAIFLDVYNNPICYHKIRNPAPMKMGLEGNQGGGLAFISVLFDNSTRFYKFRSLKGVVEDEFCEEKTIYPHTITSSFTSTFRH
jgi:hypothetical protein